MNKQRTDLFPVNIGRSLIAAASLAAFFVSPRMEAATYTWTSTTTRYWQNAFWSPSAGATGPGTGDIIGATTAVGTLRMDANFSSTYNVGSFLRTGSGTWIIESLDNGRSASDPIRTVTLNISGSLQTDSSGGIVFRSNTLNPTTQSKLALNVNGPLWARSGNIYLGSADTPPNTYQSALSGLNVVGTTSINAGRTLALWVDPDNTQLGRVTANGVFQIHRAGINTADGLIKIRILGGSGTVMVSDYAGLANVKAGLDINGALNGAFSGVVTDGTANNELTVFKSGTGVQVFSGNSNDYSGGTVASGGLLLAQNTAGSAFGSGAVQVTSTGTLGGNGFIAPAAGNDILVEGTLRPGYYEVQAVFEPEEFLAGVLNVDLTGDSKLIFETGSTLDLILGSTSSALNFTTVGDWLEGSGKATLNLTLADGFDYANTYTIISGVTTADFAFANVTGIDSSYGWWIQQVGTDYVLAFQPVPEPTAAILAAAGMTFLLCRRLRRKA